MADRMPLIHEALQKNEFDSIREEPLFKKFIQTYDSN